MWGSIVFTGLIEGTGQIVALEPVGKGHVLRIETSLAVAEFAIGESIAVDGVCL
ncbi:MAG TPA: riboflavin synthase, partial [Sneathiellales bacterium]|nr:riboflavin synthase [Sneathiellales bacterium]